MTSFLLQFEAQHIKKSPLRFEKGLIPITPGLQNLSCTCDTVADPS